MSFNPLTAGFILILRHADVKKLILNQKCKKVHSNHIFLCSQCIDEHCGLVVLPSNKLQQPDHNMNIISSSNFVQLHRFIGSNGGS